MGNLSSDLAQHVDKTVHAVLRPILSASGDLFAMTPVVTNNTVQQIEASNKRQEEQKRRLDEAEARANEREAASQKREQAAQSVAKEARKQEVAAKRREETAQSAAEEARKQEVAAMMREDAAQSAAEEARKQEVAAMMREDAALAAAELASVALHRGIRPVVMPTRAEVQAAMERIQYDKEKLHFAVCGTSGSGKSSLINAFRGLGPRDGGAAKVGVTETTSAVTRYPDPRGEGPYSRFVWYDIPGAGTTAVPDWQYFNDQGLFVFDFIVMVYDVRFTKIDVGIIENCYRFHIPVFVVRSKADQHINNMMKDETDGRADDPGNEELYEEMKKKFVEETRSDFNAHMDSLAGSHLMDARDQQMICNQRVFIVSSSVVRGLLESEGKKGRGFCERKSIDEVLLVEDMLRAAARRRYFELERKGMFEKARDSVMKLL